MRPGQHPEMQMVADQTRASFVTSVLPATLRAIECSLNFRNFTSLLDDTDAFRSPVDHALAIVLPELRSTVLAFYLAQCPRLSTVLDAEELRTLDAWLARQVNALGERWRVVEASYLSNKEAARSLREALRELSDPGEIRRLVAEIQRAAPPGPARVRRHSS